MQYLYYKSEATVTELSEFAKKDRNNISHQIGVLRRHKIVKKEMRGRFAYYSLNFEELTSDLIDILLAVIRSAILHCTWEGYDENKKQESLAKLEEHILRRRV